MLFEDEHCLLFQGDCLEKMKDIPDGSIDMILTDPPYQTTGCAWDSIIPFEPMWEQLKRVTKKNGAIVLFGSQPFTSALVMSNPKMFKCEWVWKKNAGSNFACVKYQPMKEHENILVFSRGKHVYNPQMQERSASGLARVKRGPMTYTNVLKDGGVYGKFDRKNVKVKAPELRYPSSVQLFNRERGLHPTQKPVELLKYLIRTYTNEGETVLDFTMGSGSTGVAAKQLGRRFIGIEKDTTYFEIAKKRIQETQIDLQNPKICDNLMESK